MIWMLATFCGIAIGLLSHRLRKAEKAIELMSIRLEATSEAHQEHISNLYRLRVDDDAERKAIENRIGILECRTERDGGIHGRIDGAWEAIEEIKQRIDSGVSA